MSQRRVCERTVRFKGGRTSVVDVGILDYPKIITDEIAYEMSGN
jgi:hypothetical protein